MPETFPAYPLPETVQNSLQRLLARAARARGLYPAQDAEGFLRMACVELGLPCPWEFLTGEQTHRISGVLDAFYQEPSQCLHLHALVLQQDGPVPLASAPPRLRHCRKNFPQKAQPKLA
jgi:hypothetical protein